MKKKILSLVLMTALSCGSISSLSYAKSEEISKFENEQISPIEEETDIEEVLPEKSVSEYQESEIKKETIDVIEPEIKIENWKLEEILPKEECLKLGDEHKISVKLSGNTEGLQYKYVWQKDGWKEWGVLQEFSEASETIFLPKEVGKYTLIIDIKDTRGKVVSKSKEYNVVNQVWNYEKIGTDRQSPQEKYSAPIEIRAITSGDTEGLQYKFVWQKENWKKWGVIQEFSERTVVKWDPEEEGMYTILVDVKDRDGKVITKSIAYEITKLNWNFERITISPEEIQKKGQPIEIEASVSGNVKKMQYKFVWMKDNWKEWGVIRNFEESNHVTWTAPKKSGNYQIIVDVKDRDGKVVSKKEEYLVATQIWKPGEIIINGGVTGKLYERTPISVTATGETENLQYKFVWMKDNWKEWGVIKEFDSRNSTTEWIPKEAGDYVIYVDIRDVDGRKETITQHYSPKETDWKLEELNIHGERDRFVGDKLKISAVTSGNVEGLQYKFVCRRGNDWKDWEVIQGFSTKNSVEIPLNKDKDYHIYVDIKNEEGVTCKTEVTTVRVHKYLSAGVSMPIAQKGKSVKIYPNISGSQGIYQVKYVWMKNNWKEWGVIKDFSEEKTISWSSNQFGDYTIYIDVKMNGTVQKNSVALKIIGYQNPSQYLQIRYTQKKLHGGGYNLSKGYMGIKVHYVQQKLGMSPNRRAIMDATTMNKVKEFQRKKKLPITGVVDLETWKAFGYTENQWYTLGTYVSPLKINSNSTKEDCIEAMISTAYSYLGTRYVIGAASAPATGIDCSGLVMQALYSAGLDPEPVNPIRHSKPGFEYESRNMWNLPMKKVPYEERRRGDLIFYNGSSGFINHVAIYLGNDKVIEAWPTKVVVWPIKNSHRSNIRGVMRPFV